MNDLKPFLKKIYDSAPMQLKSKNVKEIQEDIADALDTYLGHFKNGSLYMGTEEYIYPYELADLIDMCESDVEDYMEYVSSISLSSQAYYQDIKIDKNIEWARGGIQSIFIDLLKEDIKNYTFTFSIVFTPDLYFCECKAHLFYDDNTLNVEFKLKDLHDRGRDTIPSDNKELKKYTGYYASIDGSMDAQVVIDKFDLSWNRANVLKYVIRAGRKDPTKEIEDLQKAITYLNFEIEKIKGKYH